MASLILHICNHQSVRREAAAEESRKQSWSMAAEEKSASTCHQHQQKNDTVIFIENLRKMSS